MADHVSPLDATFLELEEADAGAHMHIGGVMVFDPLPGGGAPSLDAVRELLADRVSAMPRYRQRLSAPVTGGLTWPQWEQDDDFDIAGHVRRAALPSPGGDAELCEWAAEFWSHRLDRGRPLWEVVLLEGLDGGRWALVSKTHHCMVDGVGSIDVAHLLFDASPDPGPRAVREPPSANGDDPGILRIPGTILDGARAGVGALMHPMEASRRGKAVVELLVRNEVLAAPHSSLNQPLGKYRRYAYVEVPLKDMKAIKRELGGTVNDVALAATTAGLRALLLHRGEDPPESGLRAMVPVNVRSVAEQMALGNRISSLFVHLPVAAENPLVRYAKVLEDMERLKAGDQAAASSTLVELAGAAPPVLHSTVARSLFATRLFNVTVTNVPGPQLTLYSFGSPMRQVLGLVPLAAAHDVGVAILSYDGNVTFGIIADRDSVPDLDVMVAGIEGALRELGAISRTRRSVRDRRASRDRRRSARR